MKIGILGGSFDPIHKGHMHMAVNARKLADLDELWLIPAGHSPNKDESHMTSPEHRLAMTELAAQTEEGIRACDIEVVSEERSYTYRTLEKLTARYPEHEFYFIMGADSLDYFDKWRHPEIIAAHAVILVIVREGFSFDAMKNKIEEINRVFPADIRLLPCQQYDVSSSQIRSNIRDEELCVRVLNPDVYAYIRTHHLYGLQEII